MSDETRGPGPGTVERSVAAWQRAKALLQADAALANDEAAIAQAIGDDPSEAVHPHHLINRAALALKFAALRQEEAQGLVAGLRSRVKRYEQRQQALRTLIYDLLTILELPTFRSPWGTITLARGAPSVLVTDEGQIPEGYFRTVRTLDRRLLLADLKQGVVVDGATLLANGAPTLRIVGERSLSLETDTEETTEQPEE